MAPPPDPRPLSVILADISERAARPVRTGLSLHYPYIVLPKRYRWIRWCLWVLIFVGVTLLGSIGLTRLLANTVAKHQQKGINLYISPALSDAVSTFCADVDLTDCDLDALNFTGFEIVITPLKFDTDALALTVDFSATPRGVLANDINVLPAGYNVTFSTFGGGATYTAKSAVSDFSATFAAYTSVTDYPFEQYSVFMTVYAEHKVGESVGNLYELLVLLDPNSYVMGFTFDQPNMTNAADGVSAVNIELTFRRNGTTKATVVFTWIVMHGWVIMVVLTTAQVMFRGRDPDPVMTWTAAAVFTIGQIRAIQPRNPSIGTVGDVVTYVWAVLIIALASFIQFSYNFRRYKPKSELDKALTKKEKESKWREILKAEAETELLAKDSSAYLPAAPQVLVDNLSTPTPSTAMTSSSIDGATPVPGVYFPGAPAPTAYMTSTVGAMPAVLPVTYAEPLPPPATPEPSAIVPPPRQASAQNTRLPDSGRLEICNPNPFALVDLSSLFPGICPTVSCFKAGDGVVWLWFSSLGSGRRTFVAFRVVPVDHLSQPPQLSHVGTVVVPLFVEGGRWFWKLVGAGRPSTILRLDETENANDDSSISATLVYEDNVGGSLWDVGAEHVVVNLSPINASAHHHCRRRRCRLLPTPGDISPLAVSLLFRADLRAVTPEFLDELAGWADDAGGLLGYLGDVSIFLDVERGRFMVTATLPDDTVEKC
ncbi:hypothetical protein HK405_001045 [Cladochytrium tenue]|nr:hypothetical protein HK405_001045 [Cladochytrium tenue]